MSKVRLLLLSLIGLLAVLALVGGGLAALGAVRWGDSGWYYHSDPGYRLRIGRAALHRGDLDRTEQIILLLEAGGHKDHVALLRGEMYLEQARPAAEAERTQQAQGSLNRAITELNKIRDKGELQIDAASLSGRCQLFLKNYHEAQRVFSWVLDKRSDDIEAHRGLAVLYYDLGASSRAITHLKKVAELDPHDGRPHRLMAAIYKDLHSYPEAAASYEEALRRDLRGQDPGLVRKELAECLVSQAKYTEALEVLGKFEPSAEDAPATESLRAQCLLGLHQTAEARAVLDKGLALYPRSVELLRLGAKLHQEAGELQPAVDLLQRALSVDRHDYESRYQLMLAYQSLGRKTEAEEQRTLLEKTKKDLEELARLNQQLDKDVKEKLWDASLRLRLAELCQRLDKFDLAERWRKAAAACPTLSVKPPEPK